MTMEMTYKKWDKLASEIKNLLDKYEVSTDVSILYNGKRETNNGRGWKSEDFPTPTNNVEYHNNNTLNMTFEGAFNHIINGYSRCDGLMKKFDSIINKYGYYYEMGYAWSLSLHKI